MKKVFILLTIIFAISISGLKAQWIGTNPLTTTSNVGIGTTNPRARLDVTYYQVNALSSVLARLPEGDSEGEGTYLGVGSINTQPVNSNSFSIEHKFYGMINSSINFFRGGGMQGGFLTFNTNNNTEQMRIAANGNVGIGTTTPSNTLTLSKMLGGANLARITFDGQTGDANNTINGGIEFHNDNYNYYSAIYGYRGGDSEQTGLQLKVSSGTSMTILPNMNVGIGTTNPRTKLSVASLNNVFEISPGATTTIETIDLSNTSNSVNTAFYTRNGYFSFNTGDYNERLRIINNGNVGIGTTTPQYKLAVKGTIGCGEVKVEDITTWADFVFYPTYKLRTLGEVEQFIKANNHLPEIPTAKEVKENGLGLGEMNAKLLQKVEELTLYLIEQNKKMDQQQEQMSEQKKMNEKQNQIINELERKLEIIVNKK